MTHPIFLNKMAILSENIWFPEGTRIVLVWVSSMLDLFNAKFKIYRLTNFHSCPMWDKG